MYATLAELGLGSKEIEIYRSLLENPGKTAAELAKHIKQTRTNTYMLLTKLVSRGIVIADVAPGVRRYSAANPLVLQHQLREQQRALVRTRQSLDAAMPDLLAAFNLAQHRPGVVYLEGYDGLKASLEDMAKAHTDLLLWGSDVANRDPKVWQLIEKAGYKRRARGVATKTLFQAEAAAWPHINDFALKGFDVRFWGDKPYAGEVAIYDDKVSITAYAPSIVVTVLTNGIIADTFRTIFNNCWQSGMPLADA